MIKKGYVFIVLFALFIAIAETLKFRLFIKYDFDEVSLNYIIVHIAIGFLIFVIPGILLVRWYYKMKNK